MKQILAKSNPSKSLRTHTDEVLEVLNYLHTKYKLENYSILEYSIKLHDIGKIESSFQNYLITNKSSKKYIPHHHYSWAFTLEFIDIPDIDKISNLILWHHGNNDNCNELCSYKLIQKLKKCDLDSMKQFAESYGFKIKESDTSTQASTKFSDIDNFDRTILIFCDVVASKNIQLDSIENLFNKTPISHINLNPEFLLKQRTINQLDIVKCIKDNDTSLIKAPAGFGKTILGLLWSLPRTKKLIWVCPTNIISESVYTNIISDLKLLGVNVSIELYLSGERINSNNNSDIFGSDIIVTNIDNFIKPSVDNSSALRSLMIYESDVIFDEVHEINKMNCALSQAFQNIMKQRHNILNTTTLLLTATPSAFLFGSPTKPINILPNSKEHYKPIHDKKYTIEFIDIKILNTMINNNINNNMVVFSNTVKEVQNNYCEFNKSKLICHGKYLDEDKKKKKDLVFYNYGKNGIFEDKVLFSNQILTTACDYSVNHMFIISPTIITFFQSLGRINRWGNYNDSKIYIVINTDKSNMNFLGNEFELFEIFIKNFKIFLSPNKTRNLEELYTFYNDFIINYKREFENILSENLKKSKLKLDDIFPRKTSTTKPNIKAGSNKLRRTDSTEIFISILDNNGNSEEDRIIMQHSIQYDIEDVFKESNDTKKLQEKLGKKLGYYNQRDSKVWANMLKYAVNKSSPYIVFNHYYDSDLGLVKN